MDLRIANHGCELRFLAVPAIPATQLRDLLPGGSAEAPCPSPLAEGRVLIPLCSSRESELNSEQ